jgi:hypothetical protein
MSESDITNYAYVWYKRDPEQLLEFTEEELEKIYEILLNYSYPCYLAGSELINSMSPEEKTKLLQHELLFIREKMEKAGLAHIIIMQIPRVLYDLFNLYYNRNETFNFRYNCHDDIATISGYNVVTRRYTDSIKEKIFSLNVFIMDHIPRYISNIRELFDSLLEGLIKQLIVDSAAFSNIFQPTRLERINILRQTIHFEKQYSEGHTILYRGGTNSKDALTPKNEGSSGNSLSFNASMLSGCINDRNDRSGCTLDYATGYISGILYPKDKIKCSIKKFLLHDLSNEDSLFFIPPIHPFLQVYCSIELFHPRTKVGKDFKLNMSHNVRGLTCSPTFIEKSDYLVSNKTFEELNALYQDYKSTNVVNTWSDRARAAMIQAAAVRGARFQELTQKAAEQKEKTAEQKAAEQKEKAAQMVRMGRIHANYLTRLGFGGKKSRKDKKFVKKSATKSNKDKKKYNKSSRRKY